MSDPEVTARPPVLTHIVLQTLAYAHIVLQTHIVRQDRRRRRQRLQTLAYADGC
jgi:hypothetical protein